MSGRKPDDCPVNFRRLLGASGTLRIEDLRQYPLLRETGYPHSDLCPVRPELDWNVWLAHLGFTDMEVHGSIFSHFGLALRAAIEGAGLMLGRSPMIDAELAAGRLVRPFGDVKMLASKTYVAVRPEALVNDARVIAMREFLLDESCGCY